MTDTQQHSLDPGRGSDTVDSVLVIGGGVGGMRATFAENVREMTTRLQELGPNPIKGDIQLSTTEQTSKTV